MFYECAQIILIWGYVHLLLKLHSGPKICVAYMLNMGDTNYKDIFVTNQCLHIIAGHILFAGCISFFFFCGGRGLNPRPCIYYALSIPTEM